MIACALAVVPFFVIYLIFLEIFVKSPDQRSVWVLLALIPFIYFGMSAILVSAYNISHVAAYEILADIRIELGKKLFRLPLGYFNERNTGELKTVMNENVELLEFFLAHHLPEMISTIFVPLFMAILLFLVDWKMAVISVFPVVLAILIIMAWGRNWNDMIDAYLTAQTEVNSTIVEYLESIKVIKAFNQTANSFKTYRQNMANWRDSMIRWSKERAIPFAVYQGLVLSTPAFIIPAGLLLYCGGYLTIETFLMFLIVGPVFGNLFMRIYEFLRYGVEEKKCLERIYKVFDAKDICDRGKKRLNGFDITFKNVCFSYEKGANVLNNINFHVPEGTKCAIVGPSGSGKTTIGRLICRFWDVNKGEILIGGHNIKDLPLKDLLSNISMVSQDPHIFNDTILENIRIGNPKASMEEIIAVSKAAKCHEFIEKLPDGYLTSVGEAGAKLSGGEKQRIGIARALLKDAPIIILDEATVFLDPENEASIQDAISNLTKNKTVIMIAHRLHTIRNVEQILVLKEGKIVERGKYDELLNKNGLFRKMWDTYSSALSWSIKRGEVDV